tara:strand:+ start:317 stop:703 length:387 start_codon:yes stop_codon:yes gene_type:complete
MPGALDSVFKQAAKAIVADLGNGLDTTIDYTRKFAGTYNIETGAFTTSDDSYVSLKCPIEFIRSEEEEGREERKARVYISPDQIGGNQPTFQDEVTLKFAEADRAAQITNIETFRGGQEYLYILLVRF